MLRLDALIRSRTDERQRKAQDWVSRIVQDAADRGTEVSVVGSLARNRIRIHSDVELPVHGSVDSTRRGAMVERLAASHMRGTDIPYDLILASDISLERMQVLLHNEV